MSEQEAAVTESKVSTGNTEAQADAADVNGEAEATPKEIKINPLVRSLPKTDDGLTYYVYIDMLDPTVYQNTRKEFDEPSLNEMRKDFKKPHGQLQEIVGSIQENGKIAVIAGYTRTEAFYRNAHQPLIDRWNKERKLDTDSPNYLVVSDPTHREMVRNAYPHEFEYERNKTVNIPRVNLNGNVKTKLEARLKNMGENLHRSDFTLTEIIDGMADLIAQGMKQAEVATELRKSPAVISQFVKIGKVPGALREALVTPEPGETMSESDLTKLKETVKTLVDELERRMSLKANKNEEAVSFSHLREFSARVVKDKGEQLPLTRLKAMELLALLVGADEKSFKLVSKRPPLVYSVFMQRMKIAESETAAIRSGKAAAPAEAAAAPATETAASTAEGTLEGLAAQQAAEGKAPSTTPVDVKDAAAQAAAPAAPAAEVSTGKTEAAPVTPAAAAGEQNADFTDSASKAASILGVDASALDDDEVEPGPTTINTEGRKSQVAPQTEYKIKSVDSILAALDAYAEVAAQPETEDFMPNPFMICGAMGSMELGLEIIGVQKLSKRWREKLEEYAQQFDEYLNALENFAEQAGKKAKIPCDLERPQLELGDLVQEEELPEDDDDVLPEDLQDSSENDELEESDEDLGNLEELAEGNEE